MLLSFESDSGKKIESIFQVCQINRPLWSVGKICDAGCKVVFNSTGADVIHAESGKTCCSFQRRNGLYVATLNLRNPSRVSRAVLREVPKQTFTRPGR